MKPFYRFEFRRTTLMCIGCIGLMAGLGVIWLGAVFSPVWLLSLCLAPLVFKRSFVAAPIVFFICFTFGAWRGGVIFTHLQKFQPLYGSRITVSGALSDDTSFDAQRSQTEFHLTNLSHNGTALPGRVQVIVHKQVEIGRGDQVRVTGKLRASKGTSKQGVITANTVAVTTKHSSWLERLRLRFFSAVKTVLPEPYGSLGLGYLVGLKADIPKELQDQLAVTGLTHIVAVSGYNLTIIVEVVRQVLAKRSAYQSVVGTLLLVVLFIAITGGSPSINRAAIICILSLMAWYYGREFKPVLLLLLSGAITAFWNPLYIWGDPGWYLSFLAFAGVLVLAPLVTAVLFRHRQPGLIMAMLIETLSAQICTIPYIMYLFGTASVIAPLANILVLPFIPTIMFLVLVTGILFMIFPPLGQLIGVMPHALLTLQVWIIERLSQVSFAQVTVQVSAQRMYMLFAALLAIIAVLYYANKRRQKPALTEADNLVQLIEQL